MQARKLTLVEIGVGGLPSVSPPAPRYSNWFPVAYRAPDVPPVEGVTPNPVADGVLIEWDAVDQAGVIYVIERGPSQNGPWTEIYRTTETRYLYSDGSGTQWWFRITPTVRGKPGAGTVVVATPSPTTADLIEQQHRLTQEIADRIEADGLEAAARADGLTDNTPIEPAPLLPGLPPTREQLQQAQRLDEAAAAASARVMAALQPIRPPAETKPRLTDPAKARLREAKVGSKRR